ncbi:uncharacterized protein UV8b_03456 [Ustilaginoidea virens]|uniref:Uncharacterized protein n=1 Tax=Ustilaginoidea virens TaxID=1159556 RepID=A0A8E5HPX4_USTVR|nr:uncharacterized protein UV8b_03456 [Ustilaginoidea virens]QUC19215.1 hypothetical protein UV8b_03456 [Ustilaginoidea virens]
MHTIQVLAAATIITSVGAVAVPRNVHVADMRLYGEQGCSQKNEGVWTVIDDDFRANECKSLNGLPARSIRNIDTNKGCTLSLYTDSACAASTRRVCRAGQCCSSAGGWQAWSMACQ